LLVVLVVATASTALGGFKQRFKEKFNIAVTAMILSVVALPSVSPGPLTY
jgi:hypothetical protein